MLARPRKNSGGTWIMRTRAGNPAVRSIAMNRAALLYQPTAPRLDRVVRERFMAANAGTLKGMDAT